MSEWLDWLREIEPWAPVLLCVSVMTLFMVLLALATSGPPYPPKK